MARKDEFDSNPFSAPEIGSSIPDEQRTSGPFVYGNFWQRFFASLIDGILGSIIAIVIAFPVGAVAGVVMSGNGLNPNDAEFKLISGVIGYAIGIIVGWLYSALQESSAAQATLGKKAMGLKVIGLSGERISFGRATGRHFAKMISQLILMIGFLMQPFTEQKQALHDMMAGTLVIRD